jgi:hypothetical protein
VGSAIGARPVPTIAIVLAELLGDPTRLGQPVAGEVLDDARDLLEHAARAAAELGGWTAGDPLRLAKGPVTWLLRCPRRALAPPDGPGSNLRELAIGNIVDAGAKLATLGPTQPVTVERALGFLAASGDDTVGRHLDDVGPEAAAELVGEAGARLDALVRSWPAIDGAWWPRVEEPARVRLADGAVTFGGRLDVLLGGPPTDRPGLVIEVKSGRWHDAVRGDAHLYGLLVGLRDGVAPAAVLSIAAGDGATQLEPLRAEVLRHAAERVAEAVTTAGRLAAGEAPEARPGSYCAHCPVRTSCPAAPAAAAA